MMTEFYDIPLQRQKEGFYRTPVDWECLRQGQQIVLVKTAEERASWRSLFRHLTIPSEKIVELPGFKSNSERRRYFSSVRNFNKCIGALIVWVPNDRVYEGHSELLLFWLRKSSLVFVDSSEGDLEGVVCAPPFCDHYYLHNDLASQHIITFQDNEQENCDPNLGTWPFSPFEDWYEEQKAVGNVDYVAFEDYQQVLMEDFLLLSHDETRMVNAEAFPIVDKMHLFARAMFTIKRGHLLHVHVDSVEGKNAMRSYYQALHHDRATFLPLNEEALLVGNRDSSMQYSSIHMQYRNLVYKTQAQVLFVVLEERNDGKRVALCGGEVMFYLNYFRGPNCENGLRVIICSVGKTRLSFEEEFYDDILSRVHNVHVPDLDFPCLERPICAETVEQKIAFIEDMKELLVEEMVDNNNGNLLSSYILFG